MAEKITVTKSGIDAIVSDLQEQKESIASYITKLDTELGSINTAWKGKDATKYTSKMQDDYKVLLTEFNTSLQSYIDYLSHVYDEYKKVDDKFVTESIEV
jgi:uncharacterized protein YukE